MRVNLAQLLKDREVCHPAQYVTATLEHGNFHVRVRGCPWWMEVTDPTQDHDIEFLFSNIVEGIIEPTDHIATEYNMALEAFDIVDADSLPWVGGQCSLVYCASPIPNPINLYRLIDDYLFEKDASRSVHYYFNHGETLTAFVSLTATGGFLLGQFPQAIRGVVLAELIKQGVRFSEVLSGNARTDRLYVVMDNSQFFCEAAEAIFEPL